MISDRRNGRHRSIIFAVGWLILAAANNPDPESGIKQAEAQQAIANSLGNISAAYTQETQRAHGSEKETQPCQPGDDRRYSDLCAQWKAADAAADSSWWAWAAGITTIVSTAAVLVAIGLTYQANSIARDTAKRQLRAYVSPEHQPIRYRIGDKVKFEVMFRNAGATPAYKWHIWTAVGILQLPVVEDVFTLDHVRQPSEITIFPSGLVTGVAETDGVLTKEVDELIRLGKVAIFFWGTASYTDAFGVDRETHFRVRFDQHCMNIRNMTAQCERGNSAT